MRKECLRLHNVHQGIFKFYNQDIITSSRLAISLIAFLFMVGCGGGSGGGSSSSSSTPANTAPVANDDGPFTVNNGETFSLPSPGVLSNDTDDDGDPLTAVLATSPTNGTLTLNADGSFDYSHNGNDATTDSFTYQANDGSANSNTATVSLTISAPPNAPPIANDSCENTPLGTALIGNLDVSDPDDDVLSFSIVTDGTKGSTIIDPTTKTFTYTPSDANQRGEDSFTYQVDDSKGGTATGMVTVIIGETRIMALGDSITEGRTGNPNTPLGELIAYRRELYNALITEGFAIDFVGRKQNGLQATPPIVDPDNEGVGGETATEVADRTRAALIANGAELVLLHVGTNDINFDPPAFTEAEINRILDGIFQWGLNFSTPVTVFLAEIIERDADDNDPQPNFPNQNVADLNSRIRTIPSSRPTDDIVLVNQNEVVDAPGDFSSDLVHPNPSGYRKMAARWFTELKESGKLPICP